MRKTTCKVAFLLTLAFLGFDFNIFYCNPFCLVYLPIQHRLKPISGNPDFSIQKQVFLDGFLEGKRPDIMTVPGFIWRATFKVQEADLIVLRCSYRRIVKKLTYRGFRRPSRVWGLN